MTPEEKLCSRTWRLLNSAGVLWSILSFGFLTGVGFLIRGAKAKNKLWIALGVGFLLGAVGLIAANGTYESVAKGSEEPMSTAQAIWSWTWFTYWAGGVAAAFLTNKKWLIWRAHSNEVPWYVRAGASQPSANSSPVRGYDPNAAAAAFAPQTPPPATPPAPAPVTHSASAPAAALNVNATSAHELVAALGVDGATANRILEARQSLGSFTSFEQLMSQAQVPPHLLIPHRANITFGLPASAPPPQSEPPSTGSRSARRLDL